MTFNKFYSKIITFLTLISYLTTGCGISPTSASSSKAIIGSDNRTEERVPWSSWPVGVLSKSVQVGAKEAVCYATLTAPDIVTTAAHCLDGIFIERADGSLELLDDIEVSFSSTEVYKVAGIYDFFEDLDLAQLRLASPVDLSSVSPARLDSYDSSEPLRIVTAPKQVTITEWVTPSATPKSEPKPELTPIPTRGSSDACLANPPDAWTCQTMPWTPGCTCIGSPDLKPFKYSYKVWQRYTEETKNHARDEQGFLSYDLDTLPGYSGAPIFQNGELVGIHLGYDSNLRKNVGIAITEIFSRYDHAREQRLDAIRPEGISIKKIKNWWDKARKDPIETLTGTLADIDPTNPNGSLSVAAGADALTRSVKELDVMSSNSDFRKALGRIDPDHKIGTFLEDNKQTIAIVAAVALCAYGGYYLVSSGAVTGEAAFLVEVGGQSVKVASAHFASAGAGAAGGVGAFIATGGIAQAGTELSDDKGYESGSGITSVVEGRSGSGSRPSDTPKASENQLIGKYKNGRKLTTKGHNVGGQDHVMDVMTRIARLSSLDPKLFQNGINPDILTKLNKMVKDGNIDLLLLKELREALDTLGKKILSIDASLAGDIDDLADTIAMQSEYGLGVPLTSEIRKMSPGQQNAFIDRQLSASQKFINERLEEDDGRSARIESMQFMAVAGMFQAYKNFDEFNQFRAFYTQRALQFTFEFANFAIDFTGVPAMLKSAYEYSEAQPRDPKTGAPIYGTQNSMDFAIDLLSILAPKWLRKGGKSADIFQDFKRHLSGTSDGGKFLNEGLSAADGLYDDLLKSGVRAEDLVDVIDSAKKIGFKAGDDIKTHLAVVERWNSNYKTKRIDDASQINIAFGEPPYLTGSKVVEFETGSAEVFSRVHGENRLGRWVLKSDDIRGLSPLEIKEKFNLPEVPTHISQVQVPAGTAMRTGIVGPNSFGSSSGAIQFELLKEIDRNLFINTLPL